MVALFYFCNSGSLMPSPDNSNSRYLEPVPISLELRFELSGLSCVT